MERNRTITSNAGPVAMSLLRIADPFLQYSFLQSGYAARTLAAVGLQGMTASSVFQPASALSRFSVAGLNETASLVLGLMTASSLRHVCPLPYTFDTL